MCILCYFRRRGQNSSACFFSEMDAIEPAEGRVGRWWLVGLFNGSSLAWMLRKRGPGWGVLFGKEVARNRCRDAEKVARVEVGMQTDIFPEAKKHSLQCDFVPNLACFQLHHVWNQLLWHSKRKGHNSTQRIVHWDIVPRALILSFEQALLEHFLHPAIDLNSEPCSQTAEDKLRQEAWIF